MLDFNEIPTLLAALAVAVAIFLFKTYGSRSSSKSNEDGKRLPPSLPWLPLVGSLPFVPGGMDEMPKYFMKTAEKLGPVFTFYSGSRMAVILNGREAITDAMVRRAEIYADKPGLWTEANCLNKERRGIAFAHYTETFKKNHKQSVSILKEFATGTIKITEERILSQVDELFEEFRRLNGRPVYPKSAMIRTTTSLITSLLFGRRFRTTGTWYRAMIEYAAEYVENMDPAIDVAPLLRFLPMYRKKLETMTRCNNGVLKGIEEVVALIKSADADHTFVRRYLDIEGPGYDHQDLLYILRDLCIGGSETIATTVLWGFVELANHPEIQSRLQHEINEVTRGDRYPSLEDKPLLPYTEAFILELMRFHTIVPLALPHSTLRDTTASGYFVPGGSMVMANLYSVHMDPKTWKDPENLRPERFLDEDNKVFGRDRIIPFGSGRRSCIAEFLGRQEVFLILSCLVQHFKILPREDQASVKVKEMCSLITNPSPFEVRLIPRKEG